MSPDGPLQKCLQTHPFLPAQPQPPPDNPNNINDLTFWHDLCSCSLQPTIVGLLHQGRLHCCAGSQEE